MRKVNHKIILLSVLLTLLCLLDACAFRPRPARDEDGNVVFRLGFSGAPACLNPYAVCDEPGEAVLSLLYDRLFEVDLESGECVGSLCRDYQAAPSKAGGILWSIELRDDVYWHDGEKTIPVTGGSLSGSMNDFISELYMSRESVQFDNMRIPALTLLRGVTVTGAEN